MTRDHLATVGYDALSMAAVAEAGRSRPVRRCTAAGPTRRDLATAAHRGDRRTQRPWRAAATPFADLVRELESFRRGIARPDGVPMVGAMLVPSTDPGLVERYRERVVAPRRQRLRSILERARSEGLLASDADLEIAVTMATGNWYARALAGDRPPPRWADRTAALIWRSCGGEDRPSPRGRSRERGQSR